MKGEKNSEERKLQGDKKNYFSFIVFGIKMKNRGKGKYYG